jgi:hypothetical protein
MAERWPAIRAGLIALVLVVEWVDAVPLPELRPRDLVHPVAQAELDRWVSMLASVGIVRTRDEVAEVGLAVGEVAIGFRKGALAPFKPLKRITGTGQAWGLFAYPDPASGRLVIRGRGEGEEWELLAKLPGEGDPAQVRRLQYRRLRGVWDDAGDRPNPGKLHTRFVNWIASDMLTRRPDLDQIEVRIDLQTIVLPTAGIEAPPDERRHTRIRTRARLTQLGWLPEPSP